MPRKYVSRRRVEAQQETRQKIVQAVVELHAERGVLGTRYADIAARAEVSIPTVYKHFPGRAELLEGCTAHVAAAAPPLDASVFEGVEGPEERLRILADTVFERHAYQHRWSRWREAAQVPELQPIQAQAQQQLEALVRTACKPFRLAGGEDFIAIALTLLSEHAWENLREQRKLGQDEAIKLVTRALTTLLRDFRKPGSSLAR